MKIALVGSLELPISQDSTGGTEAWTYAFAQALRQMGHEVYLFANSESKVETELSSICSEKDILDVNGKINQYKNYLFSGLEMTELVKEQSQFDLIHLSVPNPYFYLPYTKLIKKPVFVTFHSQLFEAKDLEGIYNKFPEVNFAYVSQTLKDSMSSPEKYRVILNGSDIKKFQFSAEKDDYYFWLGRIVPQKGLEDAIAFAKRANAKLIIGGRIGDEDYFKTEIEPWLDNNIEYVGPLGFEIKNRYYKRAKAFLMPSKWEEPFGLVAVEANACGTPVLAYARGGVQEIVKDGVNGYLIEPDNIDQILEKASNLQIDPASCRRYVEENFSVQRMTQQYIDYYNNILGQ